MAVSVVNASFFTPSVMPGQETALLVVQTDAALWANSIAAITDGQAVNGPSLAALTAVPEPATGTLLLAGLGLLGSVLRPTR